MIRTGGEEKETLLTLNWVIEIFKNTAETIPYQYITKIVVTELIIIDKSCRYTGHTTLVSKIAVSPQELICAGA
jgi:hypothetical protein